MGGPYRKRRAFEFVTWHCCANCPEWPRRDFIQRAEPEGPICRHCGHLQIQGRCRPHAGVKGMMDRWRVTR